MAEKRKESRYVPAPPRSPAAYFWTSFILTLAFCLSAAGFIIVDKNSQKMGWGHDMQVFTVVTGGERLGFTFMDKTFAVDTAYVLDAKNKAENVLGRVKAGCSILEPGPLRLARIIDNWCYKKISAVLPKIGPL